MSSPSPHEEARPEDFEMFIQELQKLIEEAPQGYQSKFARVIADLQQKKIISIAVLRDMLRHKPGEEFDYEFLLQTLLRGLNDPSTKKSERYDAALRLAQLRAQKSSETEPAEDHDQSSPNGTQSGTQPKKK
jgi:hypothetical protein